MYARQCPMLYHHASSFLSSNWPTVVGWHKNKTTSLQRRNVEIRHRESAQSRNLTPCVSELPFQKIELYLWGEDRGILQPDLHQTAQCYPCCVALLISGAPAPPPKKNLKKNFSSVNEKNWFSLPSSVTNNLRAKQQRQKHFGISLRK